MPKRPCTQRAKWRLLRGQPSQHLSEHYQLECDYGTRLIAIYKEGDPVFLCEDHAATIGQSDDNCIAGVRSIKVESIDSNDAPKNGDRDHTPQFAGPKPSSPASKPSAPSEIVATVAAKIGRETIDPPFRESARDLTYGDATKALVDETIWNMAPGDFEAYSAALRQGKTAAEAAQAAGGQLAVVHRKISEYTLKIEAVLSKSKSVISLAEVIDKPLERAMLEIIGDSAMSDAQKDNAIDHLGAFQEQLNRGLNREITPLQAHRIARLVGDRACWGATSDLSEELRPAYRAVYASVRNAIRAAVPQAHGLDERLANLYAAKSDLENVPTAKASYAVSV
ncbi:MAG TPA: hypothetical protein VGR97_00435 [Candidatus Acidoferrales bacterium]|nr:hypothetical protein [Candidatus Acidoferrales bacterium]